MAKKSCSDEEFITLFQSHGPLKTAQIIGVDVRSVQRRRRVIEANKEVLILPPSKQMCGVYEARLPIKLNEGIIIVGSDAHYWPGESTTAHKAFCKLSRELQPKIQILNGDVFDGARISRHPPLGFAQLPTVKEELDAVEERLTEIEDAQKSAQRFWCVGNHDLRFENRLAQDSAQFAGVKGFALRDHIPQWKFAMSLWINENLVVKHRYKGGVHATHNNALHSGKSMLTGHLHSLKVTPFADYNGNRFGIDSGTMADPLGEQFAYIEDNPTNWRSGFIVLTFHKGKLLWPEIVHVVSENEFQFRGKVYSLK